MNLFGRLGVRLVRASILVDRGQRFFDRVRSTLVARFASDEFLEAYNDVAYRKNADYTVTSARFRTGLFHWEEEMARRNFPPPPCRLLIGGAGGGREVYAWASQGYEVVAFEPSPTLARAIAGQASLHPGTEAWLGRYEDLPLLHGIDSGAVVDVSTLGPFAAVVLGWPTYSHIRRREARVATLRRLAALTDGPVALSFFLDRQRDARGSGRLQRLARRLGILEGRRHVLAAHRIPPLVYRGRDPGGDRRGRPRGHRFLVRRSGRPVAVDHGSGAAPGRWSCPLTDVPSSRWASSNARNGPLPAARLAHSPDSTSWPRSST